MNIRELISSKKDQELEYRPHLFHLGNASEHVELDSLCNTGAIVRVVNDYREQLYELFQIDNPALVFERDFKERFEDYFGKFSEQQLLEHGTWVFYPWTATVVHVLPDTEFQRVRTARNRNLITEEEQKKYYDSAIGIGGLSVGNSVALAIALQGGGKRMRLADFDRLALSNLNRIRAEVSSLGSRKVEMTARQIYALNPYAELELFPEGITDENIAKFMDGLDVVIDELDNIAVKLRLREEAKRRRIPVVMGADNGDNAVVDIERYDLDSAMPFFHDRLGPVTVDELKRLDKFGIGRTITKHIGAENVTLRMQNSLLEMGKTIVSWPQLGGAALANGIAVAYVVRKILTKEAVEANRALLSLDEKFIPGYFGEAESAKRVAASEIFKKMFGL